MNPRIETLSVALATVLPASLAGISHAASVTYDADLTTTGAQDGSGTGWNTSDLNFWNATTNANVAWPNTSADEAIFGTGSGGGSGTGAAGTVTVGPVTTNKITFNPPGSGNYLLTGGPITLAGTTPTIAVNSDASIASALAGAAGLTKSGGGVLTLTGANIYTGTTIVGTNSDAGNLTYAGSGSYAPATASLLNVGGATGKGVFNMNSTGTVNFTSASTPSIGGNGGATDSGAGALDQSSGTLNLMSGAAIYLTVGNHGNGAAYGSVSLSGGTLNVTSGSGIRLGYQGMGSLVQTGGTLNSGRWFVIGGGNAAGKGVATFTGGSATVNSGFRINLSDNAACNGVMNVGTEAGGNATVTALHTSSAGAVGGINLMAVASGNTALNLNSGTLTLAGPIYKGSTGTAALNLNGGTLKANASGINLINNTNSLSANMFNGGLKVDTQGNAATISANLLATTGNGIYPAGGTLSQPSPTGGGYIGNPLVAVTTSGTGTGATAVANVASGKVTGVTLTCPGQGYNAGDQVTFTFTGGGASSVAAPFVYTLTAGDIVANGSGGLTKLGTGKLTLSGNNTFSGPVNVTGTLETTTPLTLNNTTLAINGFTPATTAAPLQATAAGSGITTAGTVPVVIDGLGSFAAGTYSLIWYPTGGSIGGSGVSAFQVQSTGLPRGMTANLVDNPSQSAVDLVVSVSPLTWKGNVNGIWDIDTTANWLIGAAAQKYLENDVVLFDDNASPTGTNVTLDTVVQPASLTFDNSSKDFTLSGTGGIGGTTPITKKGSGTVTLLNANSSTGTTTVEFGTLRLGDGTVNGSLTGPLVNNDTVIFTPSGTATHTGAIGDGNGTFLKNGPGTQVITSATNTHGGSFEVNGGTLQFGNVTTNGAPGTASYEIADGASVRFDQATATILPSGGFTGAGNVSLNSAQAVNASAYWGALNLDDEFTGVLRVEKGRVDANGSTTTGAASKIQVLDGAQLLVFGSTTPYSTPIEIAGKGWGEGAYPGGYPGGLRLAGGATATWAGSITLTADSCIMAQRGTNFTVSGPISGAFECEFYSGDPVAENGNLIVAPTVPGQNTYASTKINGRSAGSVTAGSDQAFSSGPLVVDNAILKLDGHNQSFASLAGAGGAIGNYNTATPSVLTVGSAGTSTSYAGVLRDGAAAPLALTKTGTGTLTLTAVQAYTGTTTVAQGKLALATPSLADTGAVIINGGAVLELNSGTSDIVGSLVINGTTVPTGTYDSSHASYGAYFSGTGSLVVGGAFESWAASKGLSGADALPGADPDKDGVENLAEFYLDGNPLASDPAILPAGTVDANYLTLTFHRRDDAEASMATQVAQYGSNLLAWANATITAATSTDPNGVIVTVVENDAAADAITVQIPRSFVGNGKLFGRLQVTK
jgi:autotransporter-associated beta strand protein